MIAEVYDPASRRIPYTKLLASMSVFIWLYMVILPAIGTFAAMWFSVHFLHVSPEGDPTSTVDLFFEATNFALQHTGKMLMGLNLPGILVELPIMRLTPTWPDSWSPPGLMWETWESIVLPIACIPFWAFAGLGVDAVFKQRRVCWFWLLIGSLAFAALATGAGACIFGTRPEERSDMLAMTFGCVVWTVLLAAFPAAWIRMGVERRRARRSSKAAQV